MRDKNKLPYQNALQSFLEGKNAFLEQTPRSTNPYNAANVLYTLWDIGYTTTQLLDEANVREQNAYHRGLYGATLAGVEGYRAARNAFGMVANPFQPGTGAYESWLIGWKQWHAEIEDT